MILPLWKINIICDEYEDEIDPEHIISLLKERYDVTVGRCENETTVIVKKVFRGE